MLNERKQKGIVFADEPPMMSLQEVLNMLDAERDKV